MVEPGCHVLPRGTSRQILHERGLIVNFMDLWTNWEELEIHKKIEEAFSVILDLIQPSPREPMQGIAVTSHGNLCATDNKQEHYEDFVKELMNVCAEGEQEANFKTIAPYMKEKLADEEKWDMAEISEV